jgi:hypothetical protein
MDHLNPRTTAPKQAGPSPKYPRLPPGRLGVHRARPAAEQRCIRQKESISTKLHGMGTGGPKPAPTGAADRPRSRGVFELSITGRGVLRRHAGGQGGGSDRGASWRWRGQPSAATGSRSSVSLFRLICRLSSASAYSTAVCKSPVLRSTHDSINKIKVHYSCTVVMRLMVR